MSVESERTISRFKLQLSLLSGALLVVFALFVVVVTVVYDRIVTIQKLETRISQVMEQWYQLNISNQLALNSVPIRKMYDEAISRKKQFENTLWAFEQDFERWFPADDQARVQVNYLLNGLKTSLALLNGSYEYIRDFIQSTSEVPGNELLNKSMRSILNQQYVPGGAPSRMVSLTMAETEISSMSNILNGIFDDKKVAITTIISERVSAFNRTYDLSRQFTVVFMVVCLVVLLLFIQRINGFLFAVVRERTSKLQLALSDLRSTQEGLVESRRQAATTSLVIGLSHELNTPLGVAITAQTALAENIRAMFLAHEKGELSQSAFARHKDAQLGLIQYIENGLVRMADQVNYFHALSADQQGDVDHDVKLREYFGPALTRNSIEAHQRHIQFDWDIPGGLSVWTCPAAIMKVLNLLFENSITHAFPVTKSARIAVSMRVQNSKLILHFSDNGVGIADEARMQALEPFYTTKRSEGHMGLGLNIAYNLVTHRLSGTFEIAESSPGLAFHITIPVRVPNGVT